MIKNITQCEQKNTARMRKKISLCKKQRIWFDLHSFGVGQKTTRFSKTAIFMDRTNLCMDGASSGVQRENEQFLYYRFTVSFDFRQTRIRPFDMTFSSTLCRFEIMDNFPGQEDISGCTICDLLNDNSEGNRSFSQLIKFSIENTRISF